MSTKNMQVMVAAVLVVGFSAATALVVHHNDIVANHNAMMASQAMQEKVVKKAMADGAMKQAETDKMAAAPGDYRRLRQW